MTSVKCKVNSCHYWGHGNVCKADTILIDQDQMRTDTTRLESSVELDSDSRELIQKSRKSRSRQGEMRMETGIVGADASTKGHSVRTSEATCCRTFRPKHSPKLS